MLENIHTIKVDTFPKLEEVFKSLREIETSKELFYRGMQRSEWDLLSSLEREIRNAIKLESITQETYEKAKDLQLNNFRGSLKGILKEQFLLNGDDCSNNELWAIGQHFGLKTPLLDWTKSFYVALFFAFYKSDNEAQYRSVYKLNRALLELIGVIHNTNYIIEAKYDYYSRLTAQQGIFTYWGAWSYLSKAQKELERIGLEKGYSKEKIDEAKKSALIKYDISNDLRGEIMSYLEHIGITHSTIYPDLEGAIERCNLILSDSLK